MTYKAVTQWRYINRGSTADRVLQILELDPDGWFTIDNLHAELVLRFGDSMHLAAVQRAVHRMVKTGTVERRFVEPVPVAVHDFDSVGPRFDYAERVHRGCTIGSFGPVGYPVAEVLEVRHVS